MASLHPFTDSALEYCDQVLTGKIPACRQIHQACQRHLDDLEKLETDPDYPFTFDVDKAEKVCRFASQLPHVDGRWAALKNNRFRVEPWQAFVLTSIFGWVHKGTGYRRFREAVLSVARKNGKSFLASVIALYGLLCDSEPGAQVFCAANDLTQALTVFSPAKRMCERLDDLRNTFSIEVNARSLVIPDGSRMVPIVGTPKDGQGVHVGLLDEYHEAQTDELYLSLSQSTGARTQSLMFICSTAGVTIEGPFHTLWRECEQVLDGVLDRPELFAAIYTLDKETDWTSPDALVMANPNLGVSVNLDGLLTEHQNAIKNVGKQNPFKTKKLNVWCNAASAWMNMAKWATCGDSTLKPEDFKGQPCWFAADFSTKLDLTCILKLFKVENSYYIFPRFYLPSDRALDPALFQYSKWVAEGFLTATEGTQIDMEQVFDETVADIDLYKPSEFVFDRYKAEFFTQLLGKRCPETQLVDFPMMPVQHISHAMQETEVQVMCGLVRHANNPVMNWCVSNVVGKYDHKNNIFPRKPKNQELKIDGALCLMMAVGRATTAKPEQEAANLEMFFL